MGLCKVSMCSLAGDGALCMLFVEALPVEAGTGGE